MGGRLPPCVREDSAEMQPARCVCMQIDARNWLAEFWEPARLKCAVWARRWGPQAGDGMGAD